MSGKWYDGTRYDHVLSNFPGATPKEALKKAVAAAKPGETILVRDEYFWTGGSSGAAQRMIYREAEA